MEDRKPDFGNVKILFVAMDEKPLASAFNFLKKRGWQTFFGSSMVDAVTIVSTEKPTHVLISWNMTNVNVVKMEKTLASTFNLPCIIFTEKVLNGKQQSALTTSGLKHYIVAPVSGPSVHMKIRKLLMDEHQGKKKDSERKKGAASKKIENQKIEIKSRLQDVPKDGEWEQVGVSEEGEPIWMLKTKKKAIKGKKKEGAYVFKGKGPPVRDENGNWKMPPEGGTLGYMEDPPDSDETEELDNAENSSDSKSLDSDSQSMDSALPQLLDEEHELTGSKKDKDAEQSLKSKALSDSDKVRQSKLESQQLPQLPEDEEAQDQVTNMEKDNFNKSPPLENLPQLENEEISLTNLDQLNVDESSREKLGVEDPEEEEKRKKRIAEIEEERRQRAEANRLAKEAKENERKKKAEEAREDNERRAKEAAERALEREMQRRKQEGGLPELPGLSDESLDTQESEDDLARRRAAASNDLPAGLEDEALGESGKEDEEAKALKSLKAKENTQKRKSNSKDVLPELETEASSDEVIAPPMLEEEDDDTDGVMDSEKEKKKRERLAAERANRKRSKANSDISEGALSEDDQPMPELDEENRASALVMSERPDEQLNVKAEGVEVQSKSDMDHAGLIATQEDASKDFIFRNKTKILGKNKDSILAQCVVKALEQTVVGSDEKATPLRMATHVDCIPVNANRFKGLLIYTTSADEHSGADFTRTIKNYVLNHMNELGEGMRDEGELELEVTPFSFVDMGKDFAEFVTISNHVGRELGMAFIQSQGVFGFVKEPNEEKMIQVDLESVEPERKLGFDAYLHMPKNKKYLKYLKREGSMETRQKQNMATHQIRHFYIKEDDVKMYKGHCATAFVERVVNQFLYAVKKSA